VLRFCELRCQLKRGTPYGVREWICWRKYKALTGRERATPGLLERTV
jgi:hypothetical protein